MNGKEGKKVVKEMMNHAKQLNLGKSETKEDLYYFIEEELSSCNIFMKQNSINIDLPNVLWAFKSTITTVLFHISVEFDRDSQVFNFKKVKDANFVLRCFGNHIPLFISFDNNRIPVKTWAIYDMTSKKVTITLMMDEKWKIGDLKLIDLFQDSVSQAKTEGWKGELRIMTASPYITVM